MKFLEEYNKWYKHMKGSEGGRSNHKNDKGGDTNMGVIWLTFLHFAKVFGWEKTKTRFYSLTNEDHNKIALEYWKGTRPNLFESGRLIAFFAEEFWAAGSGVTKFYQRKLNLVFGSKLTLDGVIGKQTIGVINAIDEAEMWKSLCLWKRERYTKIAERDPSQKIFSKGWARRYIRFEKLFELQDLKIKGPTQKIKQVFNINEYKKRLEALQASIQTVFDVELTK